MTNIYRGKRRKPMSTEEWRYIIQLDKLGKAARKSAFLNGFIIAAASASFGFLLGLYLLIR